MFDVEEYLMNNSCHILIGSITVYFFEASFPNTSMITLFINSFKKKKLKTSKNLRLFPSYL